jgi:hypothetical protein
MTNELQKWKNLAVYDDLELVVATTAQEDILSYFPVT